MSGDKKLKVILCGVVAAVLAGAGLLNGLATAAVGSCTPTAATTGSPSSSAGIGSLTSTQVQHADTIVRTGVQMNTGSAAQTIAIAVALQESGLRNLANPAVPASLALPHDGTGTDHDSVGLFQQRPSAGWGTPAELMDPATAARRFYTKLLRVPGWQNMPLTQAAQAVQRSAYPDASAEHAPIAQAVVAEILARQGIAVDGCAVAGTSGWVQPVHASIVSGFRTAERPSHDGVDLGAARGTTIVAASAGTVIRVRCDISPAWWGCDRDGSPTQTLGCGHFVDIDNGGGIITRYCHMLTQPYVHVGQRVAVGQSIGLVGSSGHSSGPHLHFEVHLHGDRSPNGAIDAVPFMAANGAPLGR